MKTLLLNLCAFLFVLHAPGQTFAPSGLRINTGPPGTAQGPRSFLSPNGKYRLTVESDSVNAAAGLRSVWTGTMAAWDGKTGTLQWSANFTASPPSLWLPGDLIVSDDGSFFAIPLSRQQWRAFRKDGTDTVFPANVRISGPESFFTSVSEALLESDTLNSEPIARVWDRDEDAWKAYSMATGARIESTDERTAHWNSRTRQRIIGLLERSRLESAREQMSGVTRALTSLFMTAMEPVRPAELREVHLEFLTLRRNPNDRAWLEKFLNTQEDRWGFGRQYRPNRGFTPGPADPYLFEAHHYVRSTADTLLAVYDQKIKTRTPWGRRTNDLIYLGKLAGTIRLPTPIIRNAGMIRIYASLHKQTQNADTIQEAMMQSPSPEFDLTDEVSFCFHAMPPGNYFVKAVWDKRKPFDAAGAAGVGDYESDWTGPWTVTSRGIISNVVVHCGKTAGPVDEYYKADALAMRQWKETGELSVYNLRPYFNPASVSAPLHVWTLQTNLQVAGNWGIHRISQRGARAQSPTVTSELEPLMVLSRKGSLQPTRLKIIDSHGCSFASSHTLENQRVVATVFRVFPRADETFRLVGFGPNEKEPVFDYLLTNRVKTARLNPPVMKLPLEMDLGKVTMVVKDVGEHAGTAWMEAIFMENGNSTIHWRAPGIFLSDSHGNVLTPELMCREEKISRIYGIAIKTGLRANEGAPFDFAVERLKPYFRPEL